MTPRTATLLAVAGGSLLATQSRVNGTLAGDLGSPLPAAAVSFAVGALATGAAVLASGALRPALAAVRAHRPPPWQWSGGLGGATLVGASAYAVPLIGVAFLTVCTVAGQTAGGLVVDRAGFGPSGRHRITGARAAGATLAVVALLLAAAGHGGRARPALFALLAVAGATVALQQAANGRLSTATGQPVFASFVSFVGGTVALVAVCLGQAGSGHLGSLQWPGPGHGWLYLGGLGGAAYITMSTLAVRVLGVLRLSLASIAGQLLAGVLLDVVAPTGDGLQPLTVVAVVLTVGAVSLAGRPPRRAGLPA